MEVMRKAACSSSGRCRYSPLAGQRGGAHLGRVPVRPRGSHLRGRAATPAAAPLITCWEHRPRRRLHKSRVRNLRECSGRGRSRESRHDLCPRDQERRCADLRWGSATDTMGAEVKLTGLNLRGADLSTFFLENAHIVDARLEGRCSRTLSSRMGASAAASTG